MIKFLDPSLGLSADQIAQMRKLYGEGVPVWQQYFTALGAILQGNLGYSVQLGSRSARCWPPTFHRH